MCKFKLVPAAALMAGLALAGSARPARAALTLMLQEAGVNGGALTTVAISPSITYGDFTITGFSAASDSPGSALVANLLSSSLTVKNNISSTETLTVVIGDTGFTGPQTPPGLVLQSHVGGSYTLPGTNDAVTFQSYVDPTNTQNGTGAGTFSPGPQTPTLGPGSYQSDAFSSISSLTTTYSMTEKLILTLGGNMDAGFNGRTSLTAAPEPTSLVSASIGTLLVGGMGWLRRRKAQA